MILNKIIQYWRGTVCVYAEGSYTEALLNDMTREQIPFWNVRKEDAQTVSFILPYDKVSLVEKKAMRHRIILTKQYSGGFPLLLHRYKKRWGMLVGICCGILILATLNMFVWDIKIVGCDQKISEGEVREWLSENGLKMGQFRPGLDTSQIENAFVLEHDSVIWMSINLRASTALVELQERTKAPQIYDLDTPTNVHAARDGQILEITVLQGKKTVEVGEAVQAGDLLVSGEIENKHGGFIYMHGDAIVKARTRRTITSQAPLVAQQHVATGKEKNRYTLELFGLKIPLYFSKKISYNKYDRSEAVHQWRIGKYFALPITWRRDTFREVVEENVQYNEEQAKAMALAAITQQEKQQLYDVTIEDAVLTSEIKDDILYVTKNYTCIENIASLQEITTFYKAPEQSTNEEKG